jgi:hypothetical protein
VSWVNRILNLFRRRQVDEELEEELQFHLNARTRDNVSAGMNAVAAEHDARRRLGNTTLAKERAYEMNIMVSIETIGRDLRYALRGLRKSPGFTVVAILTLALGIGANTAVFSVVDAALLRPLPYKNADRLVMIAQRLPKEPAPAFDTYREFEEWDRSSNSFERMAAATWAGRLRLELKLDSLPGVQGVAFASSLASGRGTDRVTVAGAGSPSRVVTAWESEPVSGGYFRVAGIPLLQGREFSVVDRSNSMPVAIVNESFARQYFPKGDTLGRRIKLGEPDSKEPWLTIVGIAGDVSRPTLFEGYSQGPSVYRPLPQAPEGSLTLFVRTTGNTRAIEPAVERAIVAVDNNLPLPTVQTVTESLSFFLSEPRFRAKLFSLFSILALLLAAVGIYGVLSQRVAQRSQEIGIRVALGARRDDIMTLIIGEGLRLTFIGIAIGIAGSVAFARFLSSMLYGVTPTDPLTVAGVSCLLLLVALLACYLPARRAVRLDPLTALRCE